MTTDNSFSEGIAILSPGWVGGWVGGVGASKDCDFVHHCPPSWFGSNARRQRQQRNVCKCCWVSGEEVRFATFTAFSLVKVEPICIVTFSLHFECFESETRTAGTLCCKTYHRTGTGVSAACPHKLDSSVGMKRTRPAEW